MKGRSYVKITSAITDMAMTGRAIAVDLPGSAPVATLNAEAFEQTLSLVGLIKVPGFWRPLHSANLGLAAGAHPSRNVTTLDFVGPSTALIAAYSACRPKGLAKTWRGRSASDNSA